MRWRSEPWDEQKSTAKGGACLWNQLFIFLYNFFFFFLSLTLQPNSFACSWPAVVFCPEASRWLSTFLSTVCPAVSPGRPMAFAQCAACSVALVAAASFPSLHVLKGHLPVLREKNPLYPLFLTAGCYPIRLHRAGQQRRQEAINMLRSNRKRWRCFIACFKMRLSVPAASLSCQLPL